MSAARTRFLRAIAECIPPDSVEEVRLFAPLRRGGWESGVAVVAVRAAAADVAAPAFERLTIYTARYRLALKGADRGRWEAAVSAEADAPLETVDAVARGVQHRAGDAQPPEWLPGERFRAALQEGVCHTADA